MRAQIEELQFQLKNEPEKEYMLSPVITESNHQIKGFEEESPNTKFTRSVTKFLHIKKFFIKFTKQNLNTFCFLLKHFTVFVNSLELISDFLDGSNGTDLYYVSIFEGGGWLKILKFHADVI